MLRLQLHVENKKDCRKWVLKEQPHCCESCFLQIFGCNSFHLHTSIFNRPPGQWGSDFLNFFTLIYRSCFSPYVVLCHLLVLYRCWIQLRLTVCIRYSLELKVSVVARKGYNSKSDQIGPVNQSRCGKWLGPYIKGTAYFADKCSW